MSNNDIAAALAGGIAGFATVIGTHRVFFSAQQKPPFASIAAGTLATLTTFFYAQHALRYR